MSHHALLRALTSIACALCIGVVVLGAYVRLSDAGLGCPDWPGCYSHLTPAGAAAAIAVRSGLRFQPGKAWREMLHRYAAGTLGLLILGIAACSVRWRRERIAPAPLTLGVLAMVVLQAVFGMLTVTRRLLPLIVTLHLLLGLTTLSLLWWLALELRRTRAGQGHGAIAAGGPHPGAQPGTGRKLALAGLIVLAGQIALGGWTSSHYAALACPDLPTCQGRWWPSADFRTAFSPGRGLEAQGGQGFGAPALVAIHLSHRIGALVAALTLLAAALATLLGERRRAARPWALLVLLLLATQLGIGITMVLRAFPLPVATAHNAGAALLLLAVLGLNRSLRTA
jgi:cytochrome c oxidase assembly protein subunit 15